VVEAKLRRQETMVNIDCTPSEQPSQKANTNGWPRHRTAVHQKQPKVRASSFKPQRWASKQSGVLSEERGEYGTANRRNESRMSLLSEMVCESDSAWCTKRGQARALGAVSVRYGW